MKAIRPKYKFIRIKGIRYVWLKGDFVRVVVKFPKKSGKPRSAILAECENCDRKFLRDLWNLPECCSSKCSNKLNAPFLKKLHISIPGNEGLKLIRQAILCTNNAIKRNKLVRPKKCPFCSRNIFIEGHHPNYYKPNEIMWLCISCHKKLHLGYVIQSELVIF